MLKTTIKPLVLTLTAAMFLVGCGGKEEKKSPSQVLAKVNTTEITVHQLNSLLGQVQTATPQIKQNMLDQLIDQELLVQKATELKLDREPNVLQSIETAKRQILAQAAAGRVLAKPEELKSADVERFYNENTALFAERKVYDFVIFSLDKKDYDDALIKKLDKVNSSQQVKELLSSAHVKFSENEVKRSAEQLPITSLKKFAAMKVGDVMAMPESGKMGLLVLKETTSVPVEKEKAAPLIKSYLQNEKAQADAKFKIKGLRDAAKIEYVQKFVDNKAEAASSPIDVNSGISAGLKGLK
jgi:EpsD family peptidyl-prolyl cis-trans isomerase